VRGRSSEKDGYRYLAVILGAPYKDAKGAIFGENYAFTDAAALFDWAFCGFETKTVVSENESYGDIRPRFAADKENLTLRPQEDISALLPKDTVITEENRKITIDENITAPIEKGQVLGEIEVTLPGKEPFKAPLVASRAVEKSFWRALFGSVADFFKAYLYHALFAFPSFCFYPLSGSISPLPAGGRKEEGAAAGK
jgi:D-alanyl-D-alanine carboxypeptidase (penicillin-binding protein 5/6)